jgi:hypothetical protein
MFNWLSKLFSSQTAIGKGRENPALQAAVMRSAEIFDALPGKALIDEASRSRLARQLYLDLHEIFNAASPIEVNRQKLATQVLRLAMFQVLVILPPPKTDATQLRGLPGISGELRQHLKRIVRASAELHEELFADAESFDDDDDDTVIAQRLERSFQECCWCVATFDSARVALGDVVEGNDWFGPFLFAACANQESTYRFNAGLPSAFSPELSATAPVAYSLFMDIVVSNARDPLTEWTEYHRATGIPMPKVPASIQ